MPVSIARAFKSNLINLLLYGERGRNRTFNLLIKSQLLCQLSYAPFALTYKDLPSDRSSDSDGVRPPNAPDIFPSRSMASSIDSKLGWTYRAEIVIEL
jgi:hypothetical protein